MIPIRDGLPTRRFPIVTVSLVLANVLVFVLELLVQGSGGERALSQMIYTWGMVPARVAVVIPTPCSRPPAS
jgi:membrane associated rhomboid family serine protease